MLMDYTDVLSGHTPGNFWTMARIDLAVALVQRHALAKPDGSPTRILDIGAGVGNDLPALSSRGDVDILDVDERAMAMIPDALVHRKIVADAGALPFENETYDIVVAFDVLEHIKDDAAAIGEILRVLARGGWFLATVPAFPGLFGVHDARLGHHRRYTRGMLLRLLHAFQATRVTSWNVMLLPAIALQRHVHRTLEPEAIVVRFPSMANTLLFHALRLETAILARGWNVPFGLSLVIEARKER